MDSAPMIFWSHRSIWLDCLWFLGGWLGGLSKEPRKCPLPSNVLANLNATSRLHYQHELLLANKWCQPKLRWRCLSVCWADIPRYLHPIIRTLVLRRHRLRSSDECLSLHVVRPGIMQYRYSNFFRFKQTHKNTSLAFIPASFSNKSHISFIPYQVSELEHLLFTLWNQTDLLFCQRVLESMFEAFCLTDAQNTLIPVSYTHLTLPTIYSL